jgi:hypothetical protein
MRWSRLTVLAVTMPVLRVCVRTFQPRPPTLVNVVPATLPVTLYAGCRAVFAMAVWNEKRVHAPATQSTALFPCPPSKKRRPTRCTRQWAGYLWHNFASSSTSSEGNSTGPRRLFRAAVPDHFRPMTSGETPRLKNGNKPSKNTRQAPFFSIPTVIYSVAVVI